MTLFCLHRKYDSSKGYVCSAYVINGEHPVCGFEEWGFASLVCKSFKNVEQPTSVEGRLDVIEKKLANLNKQFNHHMDIEILCRNPNKE